MIIRMRARWRGLVFSMAVLLGPGEKEQICARRLTAATLLAAETALTARVDWRTALRNILKEVSEGRRRKGEQLQRCAIGGGEIEALDCCLCRRANWGDFAEEQVLERGARALEGE